MRHNICLAIALAALLTTACGGKDDKKKTEENANDALEVLSDDRNIYGLMCDGLGDSVLYLLPPDGSNPVKYDIYNATRRGRIMGNPEIGDWVSILPNEKNKYVADMVVDLEELKGTWCYKVMPTLRNSDDMTDATKKRFIKSMPDSIRDAYFIPRDYGFTLKRRYIATAVGMVRHSSVLEDESPVEYPEVPMYKEWHMYNDKLILGRTKHPQFGMTDKNGKPQKEVIVNDTADLLMLKNDSLVLRFKGNRKVGFYRLGDPSEANKEAIKKAEAIAQKAQEKFLEKDTIASESSK